MAKKGNTIGSLVRLISKQTGLPQRRVKSILSEFLGATLRHVSEDGRVALRGFGTFLVKEKKGRKYRDIATGEIRVSNSGPIPSFRPGKALLRGLNPVRVPSVRKHNGIRAASSDGNAVRQWPVTALPEIIVSAPNPRQTDDLRIAFTPTSAFDSSEDYPVVYSPEKDSYLKLPREGRCGARGYKEPDFMAALRSEFADIEISDNFHLKIPGYQNPYEPDFVLYDDKLNLYIDIEIDEPYNGSSRQPTHFVEGRDTIRDIFFKESGWVVVRFTERQVHLFCDQCIRTLRNIVDAMRGLASPLSPVVEKESRWNQNRALQWEKELYREKYLGIQSFPKQVSTRKIHCQDQEEGIDRIIRRTPIRLSEESRHASGNASPKTAVPMSGRIIAVGPSKKNIERTALTEHRNFFNAILDSVPGSGLNKNLEDSPLWNLEKVANSPKVLFGGRVQLETKDSYVGRLSVNGIDIYERTESGLEKYLSYETIAAYLNLLEALGIDAFLDYYKKVLKDFRDTMLEQEEQERLLATRDNEDNLQRLSKLQEILFCLSFLIFNLSILMPVGREDKLYEDAYKRYHK